MNLSKFHYQLVAFPIFLFIVVFVLWASLMSIGEFVRGYGKIVPSGQVKKVQHLEGGIISEILVKEGDQVREGQVIYRIRNETAISNLSELQIELNSKLASEARLRAELSGAEDIQFPSQITEKFPNIVDNERRLFLQRKSNYGNSIRVLEQQTEQKRLQLQEDRAKVRNLTVQYDYAREQQKILERLVQSGAGSQKELIDSKLKTQNLLTDLEDTQNRMLTNQKAIEESQSRVEEAKTKFLVDVQTELSNVLVAIEKLKEQISANRDRVLRTDIASPVDGVIKTMYYNTIGGVIRPGDTVSDIIPSNEVLVIEARVQPQDRARIWPGQKVNIKVTAYDSSIHGQLQGVISDISADTFLDEGTRQPYYAVKVESNIRGFGSGKPLYPGMIAEVDVVAGERTVMSYLMKPILKIFDTSLTEP
ncbi:MAG: HlyD family type I secretion periplasmic adaptor subunit [Alphaproteobacteria bacterium]|jgi:HlyD family type I secretion membrane fusion protein|nr:HlyD family type I secretion periplasmic adaptor subunit [Alphaproteobacteria bacterium]